LMVFDCDGVLADIHSSWGYVHQRFGVDNIASLNAYLAGEIDDCEFMRRDIALWLKNGKINIKKIEEILYTVPLMPGLSEAFSYFKKDGMATAIISGGLDILAKRIGKIVNMDYVYANGLAIDADGYLNGEGILRVELMKKGKILSELMRMIGLNKNEVAVVGNSFIDVDMFNFCEKKIAFNPEDECIRKNANVIIEKKDLRELINYL
ncbi:MAG: HAD-IB family phosphatase, partial [Candidatus Thermoplasmatota archaeon]